MSPVVENADVVGFRWGRNPVPWNFLFAVAPDLSGPTSYAHQVERLKFDHILLRNAARNGVDVRENTLSGDGLVPGPDGLSWMEPAVAPDPVLEEAK